MRGGGFPRGTDMTRSRGVTAAAMHVRQHAPQPPRDLTCRAPVQTYEPSDAAPFGPALDTSRSTASRTDNCDRQAYANSGLRQSRTSWVASSGRRGYASRPRPRYQRAHSAQRILPISLKLETPVERITLLWYGCDVGDRVSHRHAVAQPPRGCTAC